MNVKQQQFPQIWKNLYFAIQPIERFLTVFQEIVKQ